MKLKPSIMGLALAGAVALCSSSPAQAQQRPIEPYYFTPKILYSHTMMDGFETSANFSGFNKNTGTYRGKDTHDKSFGGGAAIGYDFGAYSEYPIRLELEYLHRAQISSGKYPYKQTSNAGTVPINFPDDYNDPRTNQMESSHSMTATVQTVFANAYLDFPTETAFTPYVQAGLGAAYVDAKVKSYYRGFMGHEGDGYYITAPYDGDPTVPEPPIDEVSGCVYRANNKLSGQQNSWKFAWNVGAGFSYQITDSMALDLNYRYSDFGKADFGTHGYKVSGAQKNPDFDSSQKENSSDNKANNDNVELGRASGKASMDLTAHEVIFGLRISAF